MEIDAYTILYLAPIIFGFGYLISIFWGDRSEVSAIS